MAAKSSNNMQIILDSSGLSSGIWRNGSMHGVWELRHLVKKFGTHTKIGGKCADALIIITGLPSSHDALQHGARINFRVRSQI